MVRGTRRAIVALSAVAAAGLAGTAVSTAGAATITACVKTKTGEVRIRSGAAAKRKCPMGWRRMRWSTTGPAGKNGAPGAQGLQGVPGQQGLPGPALSVKDTTGAVVGQFMGIIPEGVPFYVVLRDGGLYYYLGSGQLYPLASPDWKTNDCSGTAYFKGSSAFSAATLAALVAGPFRATFRTVSATGVFGPTSAWKGRGTTEAVTTAQLYRYNSTTGVCETDGSPFTGNLAPLDSTTAPPDFTGPLTVG